MEKLCRKCGRVLPLESFHKCFRNKDGRQARCKDCAHAYSAASLQRTKARRMANQKAWRAEHPNRYKEEKWGANLHVNYGITRADYLHMLEQQGGVCALCKKPETGGRSSRLHVDHNHVTGEVRALLCHRCNIGLGMFQENPLLLQQAIEYLDAH